MGNLARNSRFLTAVLAALGLCLATSASASTAYSGGPLIERWDGTAWTQQTAPGDGALVAATAISPSDVWAVGSRYVDNRAKPIAEHWNGSSWEWSKLPTPGPKADATLAALSAASPADVWAVGGNLFEHWNGSTWTLVRVPKPWDAVAVAALSRKSAWAVGSSRGSFLPKGKQCCWIERSRTLVLHWNGSAWRRVPSPNPAYTNPPGVRRYDDLRSVVAVSPHNVWAVGDYFRSRHGHHAYQSLILHWNGASWKQVASPNPGGWHATKLFGVTAVGPRNVWAVGEYHNGHGADLPLVLHWSGSSWKVVPAPVGDPYSSDEALHAVAPSGGTDIWAAGYYETDACNDIVVLPLLEHWDGTSWTQKPLSDNADCSKTVEGIAVASPSDVWAVGSWFAP
jgi:hypothetical protein